MFSVITSSFLSFLSHDQTISHILFPAFSNLVINLAGFSTLCFLDSLLSHEAAGKADRIPREESDPSTLSHQIAPGKTAAGWDGHIQPPRSCPPTQILPGLYRIIESLPNTSSRVPGWCIGRVLPLNATIPGEQL